MPDLVPDGGAVKAGLLEAVYSLSGLPYVENITIPTDTIGSSKRFGGAMYIPFPEFITTDAVTASFMVDGNYKLPAYLETWKRMVYNPYGMTYSARQGYVRPIWALAYDVRDSRNWRFAAVVHDAFPTNVGTYSFEYEGSTFVKVDATFECRAVEIRIPNPNPDPDKATPPTVARFGRA